MNAPLDLAHSVSLVDFNDRVLLDRIEGFVVDQKASLFHRPGWLRAVEQGTGQRAAGLVAQRLGTVTGWLPLTEVRSKLFGRALISSGFGVGGGICAEEDSAKMALATAAQRHAESNGFRNIELRGGQVPSGWRSWNDKHCGFERALAADDEAELLAIPRKARAEVRKGLKQDLDVRVGRSRSDLAAHFATFSASVHNLGTPVFPRKLFAAMLQAFPDSSDILTVFKADKPLASVLSFYHAEAVMPFWGGGTLAARSAHASELMYYELMRHARRRGMARFDFGRSKTGSGPFRFKKNWGFDPVPLTYAAWDAPGCAARDVDPTSKAYARKIELWKRLPLPLANAVGPLIARGLA
ncbi:MAG: FemAB family XrtA/PEP-CTERM system-associated protein [Pseudomonadota bacterium]